jgi:hypothetical protein
MIKKVIDKLTGTNTNINTNTNNDNKQNEINNKLVEVKNFRQIEEYCCNGYQEYFDNISSNNLEQFKFELMNKVLNNDDSEMLEYLLKRFNKKFISSNDLVEKFKFNYLKDSKNFKNIIKILIEYDSEIKKILLNDIYFKNFCAERKIDFVKEIYNLRQENKIPKIKFNITDISISNYSDPNVLYWLIDEDFFDFKSINPQMLEKTKVKLFREYLRSSKVELDILKILMDKLNFKTTDLVEIFNKINNYSNGYAYIIEDLIQRNKSEIIYYLFEHIKPEDLLIKDRKCNYIKQLIYRNNYELFMFVMKHLANLKLLSDFTYYDNSYIIESINDDTDYQIIYELLKLNIEPRKGNKYFELYKMINKFNNNQYL